MLNKYFSFYENIKSPKNNKMDFSEIMQLIKGSTFQLNIQEFRKQLYSGNDELAKTIKESLPAFTPSGVFENDHKATSLIEYSGIIHVDIDKISELELNELEQKIKNSNDILAFFRSPSGKGLKVFFKCDDIKENHTKNIIKLLSYFKNKYGIEPDKSCKDINRLCFISFDQNAFYNENAISLNLSSINNKFIGIEIQIERDKGFKFIEGQRNNFIFHFALISSKRGIEKLEIIDYLIHQYAGNNFTIQEIESTIKSALKNETNKDKSFSLKTSKYDQIKEALDFLGYKFKINTVRYMVDCWVGNEWIELNETILNDIIIAVNKLGVKANMDGINTVLYSSHSESYDPFKKYLIDLEEWDGEDYIGELWATLCLDNTLENYFRKWFCLLVASMIDENISNPYVLTLIGKQGVGKTRWLNKLIPKNLKQYFYQGIPDLNDKDTKIAIAENLIINVDEMAALNKSETNRLKEFITSIGYKVRAPFGRMQIFRRKRASFCASLNNNQFLMDKTGSRRFLCINLGDTVDHNHNLDMNKIYAQGLAVYLSKENLFFTDEETAEIQFINESFSSYSMERELLLEYIRIPNENQTFVKMTATEIGKYISERNSNFIPSNRTNSEIGLILSNSGFEKTRSGGVAKYHIFLLKEDSRSGGDDFLNIFL